MTAASLAVEPCSASGPHEAFFTPLAFLRLRKPLEGENLRSLRPSSLFQLAMSSGTGEGRRVRGPRLRRSFLRCTNRPEPVPPPVSASSRPSRPYFGSASVLGPAPAAGEPHAFSSPMQHTTPLRPPPDLRSPKVIPERFFPLSKCHFVVLKSFHHLHQLDRGFPPTIVRTQQRLASLLTPAFPTETFSLASTAAADSWAHAAFCSLKEHYRSCLDSAFSTLRSSALPRDVFEASLHLVSSWARKQLGRKLLDRTLECAYTSLRQHQLFEPTPTAPPSPSLLLGSTAPAASSPEAAASAATGR